MNGSNEEALGLLLDDSSYTCANLKELYKELQYRFKVRPLQADDHLKGYLELISNGETSAESLKNFTDCFNFLQSLPDMYHPIVVEETNMLKIVATGVLVVEQKFIHQVALRSRIENILVHKDFQEKGLETVVMETLSRLAEKIGCYKVNVSCPLHLLPVAENLRLVYEAGQNIMKVKFPDKLAKDDNDNVIRTLEN